MFFLNSVFTRTSYFFNISMISYIIESQNNSNSGGIFFILNGLIVWQFGWDITEKNSSSKEEQDKTMPNTLSATKMLRSMFTTKNIVLQLHTLYYSSHYLYSMFHSSEYKKTMFLYDFDNRNQSLEVILNFQSRHLEVQAICVYYLVVIRILRDFVE